MSELDITIRDAAIEDAEVIARFNEAIALETENRSLDRAMLLSGVRRGLGRPETCRYFVAERGGRVVGQIMLTYEWSDWRDGMCWWIQSVYVEADARRGGVFRALYRHVEQLGEADPDCCGLRLYVERDNHKAQATYRSLGMSETPYNVFELDWSGLDPHG